MEIIKRAVYMPCMIKKANFNQEGEFDHTCNGGWEVEVMEIETPRGGGGGGVLMVVIGGSRGCVMNFLGE